MLNEPVRGVIAEPGFFSLSGLEQLRAYLQGRAPATPHAHLFGYRLTQATSGTAVVNQPISPWFDVSDGWVDLSAAAELGVFTAALTATPAATRVRTTNMSIRYLRPCTVDNESVIVRSRILHAGSNVTTVEVFLEDALGRAVAHATGSTVLEAIDPPPPALAQYHEPIEDPSYPSPGPPSRPLPRDTIEAPASPLSRFLGAEFAEVEPGRATATMPTSEWFCNAYREVSQGILGALGSVVARGVANQLVQSGERFVTINLTYSFPAPVPPDGRYLQAVSTLRGRRNEMAMLDIEINDADGDLVLVGHGAGLVREATARPGQRKAERVLLTVLFTDVVGSTERVKELGDSRWRELLDEHHALVRRALELHKGKEVNTAGDGFLATFDSPSRAVQCARAIRDAVRRLGLEIYAGIHTGECEVAGRDVSGIAVHVASRVQSAALPGEILLSSTVCDLIGSDVELVAHEPRALKGLEGQWRLFALA